jgi:phenylpyruvate tautomerase PptA (4-oxalocrotonate tautomerase family)
MPMVDLTYREGALTEEAKTELHQTLWRRCLRWEGIPDTPATAAIAWVYLDERPPTHISVAGEPPAQPVYRAHVRVMQGFMEQSRVDGMIREITEAILAADGRGPGIPGGAPRVFCLVEEVPSGTWGVDGVAWHSATAAELIGADPERVQKISEAVARQPRIDVPV